MAARCLVFLIMLGCVLTTILSGAFRAFTTGFEWYPENVLGHRGMLRFAVAMSMLCLQAQESSKPVLKAPPGVEEALKTRVMAFFDLQQDGKFRQAESYVCEDTKDHYYNMDKQRHKGSQFVKIFWEEGFKQAKAQVNLDMELNTFSGSFPAKFPMMSFWRVEADNWCYYIPKRNQDFYDTPFGMMKRDPSAPRGAMPPTGPVVTARTLESAIQVSKTELDFNAFRESSQEVLVQNMLQGETDVQVVVPNLPGLSVTLERSVLKPSERLPLKVHFKPDSGKPQPPVTIMLVAGPLSQVVEIRLLFDNRPPQ